MTPNFKCVSSFKDSKQPQFFFLYLTNKLILLWKLYFCILLFYLMQFLFVKSLSGLSGYFSKKEVSQTFIDRDVYPGFDDFYYNMSFIFSKESLLISEKLEFKGKLNLPTYLLVCEIISFLHIFLFSKFSYEKFIFKV